jgi:hypothetical protein
MVTINDIVPFHVLIHSDAEVSLMSLHVFLTLQIPISSLTSAPPIQGPNNNVMETHGSVMLPVALGAVDNFQTFLVNFFIVDPMLITGSRAGVGVRRSDVLWDFVSPCAHNFR